MSASDPHRHQEVAWLGAPLDDARSAMVLMHGRGADAASILELGRYLRLDGMVCAAPDAASRSWYPHPFTAPIPRNQPWLDSGLAFLHRVVSKLEEGGIPRDRIILAGFSQGACLASEFAARNPGRWGGLLVFSGGLIGPPGMAFPHTGDMMGTAVFMGCSDRDPHIPLERFRETGRVLTALGAHVDLRVYPEMGHTIVEDELAAARGLVRGLAVE